jgi:hypothetical protein
MPEFPQFFYQRVNGSLVCKKVFDAASAEELRRQGFKLSAELWPAVATAKVEPPSSAELAA